MRRNPAGKELVIDGQGTWTVNPTTGEFTFTPVPGFVGSPAQVSYVANTTSGAPATGTGFVTITYPTATIVPASTVGPQGSTQNSTDKDASDLGRTTAEMFPSLPADWYGQADSPVKFQLLDAQGNPVDGDTLTVAELSEDGKTLTVPGQGEWKVLENGTVAFIPEPDFVGDVTPVELDYARTDGAIVETLIRIQGTYIEGALPPVTETETATATATETEKSTETEKATETTTTTEKVPGGGSSNGDEIIKRCFGNAVRSPILWVLPLAILGQVGGKFVQPYIGQYQAQLNEMNAEIQREIRKRTPDFGFGSGGHDNDQYNELMSRVNAANAQLQQVANDPMVQQIGKGAGVILAFVAAGAVLYDWCFNEPGQARTAIGGLGAGSSNGTVTWPTGGEPQPSRRDQSSNGGGSSKQRSLRLTGRRPQSNTTPSPL